jgi:hypothetical protein
MYVRPITYNDLDGNKRTEDFMFNMSEGELMEMHLSTTGGLDQVVRRITSAQDIPSLFKIFKDLILNAYGVKSLDGRRFEKEDENGRPLKKQFEQCPAYSVLLMEMVNDADKAVEFITNIMPAHLRDKALEESKKFKATLPTPDAETSNN